MKQLFESFSALALVRTACFAALAAAPVFAAPMPCNEIQTRYSDLKAGDSWLDLKSAYIGMEAAAIEENTPEQGTTTITYAGEGCVATFVIRDAKIGSKKFDLRAAGFGGVAANPNKNSGPADLTATLAQLEAALAKLKVQTAQLEAMHASLKNVVDPTAAQAPARKPLATRARQATPLAPGTTPARPAVPAPAAAAPATAVKR
jgi:hypothetical protein